MRLPAQLLRRKADAHKGDFGHVFILAGSGRYVGASLLCSEAALRAGAGLITVGIPKSLHSAFIKRKLKEVMTVSLPETSSLTLHSQGFTRIRDFSSVIDLCVIGPGLTENLSTQRLIRKVIFEINKPMIIDADGINALSGHLNEFCRHSRSLGSPMRILTPHPGEMARILGITSSDVQSNRQHVAREFARAAKVTVVLKGHRTIVADPLGKLYINTTGNPGMATAGSGDVLTGIIAAFLGQRLNAFQACRYAVYIHGLAGDLAAKEKTQMGLIASDIIAMMPKAIKKCSL